jgi:hypothetical protein
VFGFKIGCAGAHRFEAGVVYDAMDKLPPVEGPKFARLLVLLADSDFTRDDTASAVDELVRTSEGPDSFEDANEWGYVALPATLKEPTGEALVPGEALLDAREAEKLGVQAMAQIYLSLSQIDDAQTRREIISDCCKIIELRLHFDFTNSKQG